MAGIEVQTTAGLVRGEARDQARRWRGIPYAQARRFAAPEPCEPWQGVRDTTEFGRQCPQQMGKTIKEAFVTGPDRGEDCLFLNIWVPDGGAPGPKPVFFWIHGGAFTAGSSNPYDGEALATLGDVIVVTINYRTGIFGFVNLGDVLGLPDIPSNLGLRDQIAALQWVKANIAAFGGDPWRVTIAGESAGSMSVSLLMLSGQAQGLFHGAVLQSGAVSMIHSRESSERIARRYAELLDLNQGAREQLMTLSATELLTAQARVDQEERGGIPAAPWYDGDLLPASLEEAHRVATPGMPVLAGTTRDEVRLFELVPGEMLPTRWAQLEALIHEQLPPDHARRVLATYAYTKKGRRRLATDLCFAMPTRNFAHRHSMHSPTWFYRFDYSHPLAGAAHGLDLTFTWPFSGWFMALVRGGPMTGKRAALADRMRRHLASFTHHGTPGDDWPAYRPDQRNVRIYDLEDRLEIDPNAESFAAWAGRDVAPRSR